MRCLEKNKQEFYYALYDGEQEVKDSDGYYTGARKLKYKSITKCKGNISPTTGKASLDVFGTDFDKYTRVILMDKSPITENSIVWLGVETPTVDNFNYIVTRVAQGLNSVAIAIMRV